MLERVWQKSYCQLDVCCVINGAHIEDSIKHSMKNLKLQAQNILNTYLHIYVYVFTYIYIYPDSF